MMHAMSKLQGLPPPADTVGFVLPGGACERTRDAKTAKGALAAAAVGGVAAGGGGGGSELEQRSQQVRGTQIYDSQVGSGRCCTPSSTFETLASRV
jgi:hypothetical protein